MKRWPATFIAIAVTLIVAGQTAFGACTASISPTPNVGTQGSGLLRIAGTSSTDVWSVGSYNASPVSRGVIEHFDGSTWRVSAQPRNPLADVTALTVADAWAVDGNAIAFEHWNGATWRHVLGAPPPPDDRASFDAISGNAANANEVWAVGTEGILNVAEAWAFAEKWDGKKWTRFRPPGGLKLGELLAVSTTADGRAWAVGDEWDTIDYFTVVDHWTGNAWVRIPAAHPQGILTGVYAVADDDVWTTGTDGLEHWNGHRWSSVPFLMPAGFLAAISGASRNDVWAVGGYFPSASSLTTLSFAAHWNGRTWRAVSTPNSDANNELLGAFDTRGNVFTAGDARSPYISPPRNPATLVVRAHC